MNQNEEFLDKDAEYPYSPVSRFEEMLTLKNECFFDVSEFEQIIDHYEPYDKNLSDNVVDLALEREIRKLEHGR